MPISKIEKSMQKHLPESAPIALKINHHQPFLLIRSSEDQVAIDTYSLIVATSIMLDTVRPLAPCACSRLNQSTSCAYSSTVPALSRYRAFDRVKLKGVSRSYHGTAISDGSGFGQQYLRMTVSRSQWSSLQFLKISPCLLLTHHPHIPPLPAPAIISPTRQFSTQRLLNTLIPASAVLLDPPVVKPSSCLDGKYSKPAALIRSKSLIFADLPLGS